jgi:hypothetical protein
VYNNAFIPDRNIALGILMVFDKSAPFWRTCSKLSDIVITSQIIGRSILIGAVVLGGRIAVNWVKRAALYGLEEKKSIGIKLFKDYI